MVTKLEQTNPNYTDLIVPVFVHSACRELLEEDIEDFRGFFKNCRNMTGIMPIVVLNHKTEGNVHKMEKVFQRMGISKIYKLENYTEEDHFRDREKHEDILKLIYGAIEEVRFRMKERLDPKQERIERKQFLLKYIHEHDMEERRWKAKQELCLHMRDL